MYARSIPLLLASALIAGCFSPGALPLDDTDSEGAESGGTDPDPGSTGTPPAPDPDPTTTGTQPDVTTDSGDPPDPGPGSTDGDITTSNGVDPDTGTSTDDGPAESSEGGTTEGALSPCSDMPIIVTLPGAANTACGGQWDVAGVPLQIQNSLHQTCGGGGCSAGSNATGVWLYPAQLFADLGGIDCEPSVVQVDVTSYGADVRVTLFDTAGSIVAEADSQLNGFPETVSVAVPLGVELAGVGMHGCEDLIHEIRVQ